jgi:hypothetical protein
MYVCLYVCMYVCMHACMYVCNGIFLSKNLFEQGKESRKWSKNCTPCTYTDTYIHPSIHLSIQPSIHTDRHTYIHAYIHHPSTHTCIDTLFDHGYWKREFENARVGPYFLRSAHGGFGINEAYIAPCGGGVSGPTPLASRGPTGFQLLFKCHKTQKNEYFFENKNFGIDVVGVVLTFFFNF